MRQAILILLFGVGVALAMVFVFSRGRQDDAQSTNTARAGTSIGDRAPDFAVETTSGERLALGDFLGSRYLVITSTASWCPTCIIEAREFSPVYPEFAAKEVEFLSVSIDPSDDDEKLEKFKEDYTTPWHYTHPGRSGVADIIKAYQFTRFEITYIIDKQGTIRFKDSQITASEKLRDELQKALSNETAKEIGAAYPIQEKAHIKPGETHPPYNSNPPTSGWHFSQPANWGIHQGELPDEQVVHNLEHGGVWVAYHPRIGEEQKQFLENLLVYYTTKVIVSPREKNEDDIALASWGRLLTLSAPLTQEKEDLIVEFIERYKNRGPEIVPDAQ